MNVKQSGKKVTFCGKSVINDFNKICDQNFEFYVLYQDHYLNEEKKSLLSMLGIRSKIKDFLLSDELSNKPLNIVPLETIDMYFYNVYATNNDTKKTFISRVDYINGFLKYLFEQGLIPKKFNSEKFRGLQFKEEATDKNKKKAITPKQVSEFHAKCKDKPEYLYVFDMKYYTDFDDEQIQSLTMKNVDISNRTITIDEKSVVVPESVINNIIEIDRSNRLGELAGVKQYFIYLKPVFEELGFKNIKPKDITLETKKRLSFTCPQCGNEYEAIVENWCAVQYTESGAFWIVCRGCGSD